MGARYDPRAEACLTALTTGPRPHTAGIGLVAALEDAERFSGLVCSTPGETVAVIEYLLALIYASRHVPRTTQQWRTWVDDPDGLKKAAQWLRERPDDEWNLFDPDQPLGQNRALAKFIDTEGVGPAQLAIEQAGDYNQFFDHRHLHATEPMPAGQAFRALLTQMAYGLGGNAKIKPGLLGRGMFSQSVARLGGRVRVVALGRTLGHTLRLNTAPATSRLLGTFNRSWTDERGPERRSFRGAKVERDPDGLADVHSFLCRSVFLRPVRLADGSFAVDQVLVGSGELLPPLLNSQFAQDAVMVDDKDRRTLTPLKASPDRALWREAHALYAAVAERQQGEDLYGRLAGLPEQHINLWAVGLVARQSAPTAWVADEFPYVSGREQEFRTAAKTASEICEYLAVALRDAADTASAVVYPNPKPADKATHRARFNGAPQMWAGAGDHFHMLLDAIAEKVPLHETLPVFVRSLAALAGEALDARLRSLPDRGAGMRARLEARHRLRTALNHKKKAPDFLKEALRDA
ncbi:type I-E CRISPR-associated protein Cse1/CasA [Streptomyces sp. NPDC056244]|uniref:type I-E CRISPR-associated protein Cse1/CasA n=1 Tax=Streptomyces sp. NPDC056244 TaxID=3345762 RepID=UPI0035D706B5